MRISSSITENNEQTFGVSFLGCQTLLANQVLLLQLEFHEGCISAPADLYEGFMANRAKFNEVLRPIELYVRYPR